MADCCFLRYSFIGFSNHILLRETLSVPRWYRAKILANHAVLEYTVFSLSFSLPSDDIIGSPSSSYYIHMFDVRFTYLTLSVIHFININSLINKLIF